MNKVIELLGNCGEVGDLLVLQWFYSTKQSLELSVIDPSCFA